MKLALRIVVLLFAVALIAAIGGGVFARSQVRASLPQLDGNAAIDGLTASVKVDTGRERSLAGLFGGWKAFATAQK